MPATTARDWFAERAAAMAAGPPAPDGLRSAVVEREAAEGRMPPLHLHDQGECYRVVAGEVTFHIGTDVVVARADDVVVAPAGVPRTFRAGPGGARWLVLTRVRSLERFLDFGRAIAVPSGRWTSPAERSAVAAMAAANGIELLGPPGALPHAGA